MEPLDNPSKDFPCCIWIREQTCLWLFGQWLLVSLWSVFGQWLFGQSRKLLLLLSLAGWILPPSPTSDVNSKPVVQPGSYAMDCVGYTAGWPTIPHIPGHHPTLNSKHACGRGAVEPGCEAAVIFQSTYGVSVTFRVTPTWVKCMFWRTSPMADRHSSPREKRGRKSHLLWSRWVQSFFICLIQTGWGLQR